MPFYMLAFTDGRVFLARHVPDFYDRNAKRILSREILPGSTVRVRYEESDGVRWMSAIQIIALAEAQSPFDPITTSDVG